MIIIIIKKIEEYHLKNEHDKIIELMNSIDDDACSYDLVCLHARALNNTSNYYEAIEMLLSVEEEGSRDEEWLFFLGYAYYFVGEIEKAKECFEHSRKYGEKKKEESLVFLAFCYRELQQNEAWLAVNDELRTINYKLWERCFRGQRYTKKERKMVKSYIEKRFGKIKEIIPSSQKDFEVEICVIAPQKHQNYTVLVTLGMGSFAMKKENSDQFAHCELMMFLPKDWDLNTKNLRKQWPLLYLQRIARLPYEENGILEMGHQVICEESFASDTQFNSFVLLDAILEENQRPFLLENGGALDFHVLFPLYREESEYLEKEGIQLLQELLEDTRFILDINRPNYFRVEDRYRDIKKQINRLRKS